MIKFGSFEFKFRFTSPKLAKRGEEHIRKGNEYRTLNNHKIEIIFLYLFMVGEKIEA